MKLSVIIPTYNREGLIKFTLDSLKNNLHLGVDLEVIVIDDGSTDNTLNVINSDYPEVKLLKNSGKGTPAARNTGLAAATGKYISYLDSDDLIGEQFFNSKIAYLEQHADTDACYGGYEYFESDGAFKKEQIMFKHKYPMYTDSTRYAHEHMVNYLSGSYLPANCIVWRKDFLLKCKGHDVNMLINQDVELFIRSLFNGLRIIAIDDKTSVYIRKHSLDARVGDPGNASVKWQQILQLRKRIHADLKKHSFEDDDCLKALSTFLFNYWKMLRHSEPAIATEYLELAKKVYWPVPAKGNAAYRMLATILGPVRATELKYSLLKRD